MPRPRATPLLFLLCLLAQLLIAAAPLWHHHDPHDADDAPDQCSVCAAVLTSGSGDVPPPPAPSFIAPLVEVLATPAQADIASAAPITLQARGPPAPALA